MSRLKLCAFIALITLAFGVALVADAMAGERSKGKTVIYYVKWESLDVPGQEKHLVASGEAKGISNILEGKDAGEAIIVHEVGIYDIDLKTGTGSGVTYGEGTDKAGNKYYYRNDAKRIAGQYWGSKWEGEVTYLGGTGKYKGIQGKGTISSYPIAPMQVYGDWEADMEFAK